MTSPGDSGGGCAGEAASLIQVDGIMLVERRDAIDSFKQEGFFFRTVQTRRCHPAAYGYPHALGLF